MISRVIRGTRTSLEERCVPRQKVLLRCCLVELVNLGLSGFGLVLNVKVAVLSKNWESIFFPRQILPARKPPTHNVRDSIVILAISTRSLLRSALH